MASLVKDDDHFELTELVDTILPENYVVIDPDRPQPRAFRCPVHRLLRVKGSTKMYRCAHPRCQYQTSKEFLLGKYSLCNFCESQFTITRKSLRLARPHCGCQSKGFVKDDILDMLREVE